MIALKRVNDGGTSRRERAGRYRLLDCNALREIARFIHVAAELDSEMIREQLQGDDGQDWHDVIGHSGERDDVVCDLRETVGAIAGGNRDHGTFARADLLDVVQVFRKDGTFVQEAFIAKETFGSGSVWDIGFSVDPQQQFAFVVDGTNQQVYVLDRKSLKVLSTFGGAGHWAGQFYGAHNLAVNSRGDLFITETYEGKRVQKFVQVRNQP